MSKLSDQIMIRAWAKKVGVFEAHNRMWMDIWKCLLERCEAINDADEAKPEEFPVPQ